MLKPCISISNDLKSLNLFSRIIDNSSFVISISKGKGIEDLSVKKDLITGLYHNNYGVTRFATETEAILGKLDNVAISPATLSAVNESAVVYKGIWGVDSSTTDYSFFETYRQSLPTGIIKSGFMWFVGGLPTTTNPAYYTGEFDNPTVGQFYTLTILEPTADKTYTTEGIIDFSAKDNSNFDFNINRLKHFLATSEIDNNLGGKTIINAETIHFANKYENSLEILKEAREIINPEPVNYIKAKNSGWV